jgi:hypothetical protein
MHDRTMLYHYVDDIGGEQRHQPDRAVLDKVHDDCNPEVMALGLEKIPERPQRVSARVGMFQGNLICQSLNPFRPL